jgi:hypothetical protein
MVSWIAKSSRHCALQVSEEVRLPPFLKGNPSLRSEHTSPNGQRSNAIFTSDRRTEATREAISSFVHSGAGVSPVPPMGESLLMNALFFFLVPRLSLGTSGKETTGGNVYARKLGPAYSAGTISGTTEGSSLMSTGVVPKWSPSTSTGTGSSDSIRTCLPVTRVISCKCEAARMRPAEA